VAAIAEVLDDFFLRFATVREGARRLPERR
jgi:hypothetical protein